MIDSLIPIRSARSCIVCSFRQCNECSAKRAALKRCCLSALPNHLILHLKRFEFDFEAMRTIKINDRFSFPMTINMHPYTKHGLQQPADKSEEKKSDEAAPVDGTAADTAAAAAPASDDSSPPVSDFDYRLSGILVHSGVADAGHYYSYVRSGSGADDDSWIELNDEIVTPFDPNNIPQAAFGGLEGPDSTSGTAYEHSQQNHNSNNKAATRDVKGAFHNTSHHSLAWLLSSRLPHTRAVLTASLNTDLLTFPLPCCWSD